MREHQSQTLAELFSRRAASTPNALAFQFHAADGRGWEGLTWRALRARVRAMACGLSALELPAGTPVAILASTRVEWIVAHFAIIQAGLVSTPIPPQISTETLTFILRDAGVEALFAEDAATLERLGAPRLETLRKVILFDAAPNAFDLTKLEALGAAADKAAPGAFEDRARAIRPDQLATLLYTGGTHAHPKGVELTHEAWTFLAHAVASLRMLGPDDHQYLWLPLAHASCILLLSAQLALGFSTTINGRIDTLLDELPLVRPTFMAAPPRVFERLHDQVLSSAAARGEARLEALRWAISVGTRAGRYLDAQEHLPRGLALKTQLADRLVFRSLRERLGGRLRFFLSGSAPLSRELAETYRAAGLPILESYGLTEAGALSSINRPGRHRLGSAGLPLPGVELKVADDGEILIRSQGNYRNYRGQEKGGALLDGWLHTGDLGRLDPDGFVWVTGRKDARFKTSRGAWVDPAPIESMLKGVCPFISQALIYGEGRPFSVALLTLDPRTTPRWSRDHGAGGTLPPTDFAHDPDIRRHLERALETVNGRLEPDQRIARFTVLDGELTLEAGELTPSLTVRRTVVLKRHQTRIEALYQH